LKIRHYSASHLLGQAQTEVKVIVIGDYGVGKTSFIKRHINGFIAKRFLKESGCHMHPLVFSTSKCSLELQVTLFVENILQKDVPTIGI
jgi:GTPase SAR1 family protein